MPCTRKETLQRLANYVVADTYFSKSTFVDGALEMGFHVISRFRDDAYFRYLITEEPTGKRGRPKLYDGKIEMEHLEARTYSFSGSAFTFCSLSARLSIASQWDRVGISKG